MTDKQGDGFHYSPKLKKVHDFLSRTTELPQPDEAWLDHLKIVGDLLPYKFEIGHRADGMLWLRYLPRDQWNP